MKIIIKFIIKAHVKIYTDKLKRSIVLWVNLKKNNCMLIEKLDMYYTIKTIFNSNTKACNKNLGGQDPLRHSVF